MKPSDDKPQGSIAEMLREAICPNCDFRMLPKGDSYSTGCEWCDTRRELLSAARSSVATNATAMPKTTDAAMKSIGADNPQAQCWAEEYAKLERDRDMWLRDSAKQNDNLGRVIAERDALRSAIATNDELRNARESRDRWQAEAERIAVLLRAAKCPNSNCERGEIATYDKNGDLDVEPCQWCHERQLYVDGGSK